MIISFTTFSFFQLSIAQNIKYKEKQLLVSREKTNDIDEGTLRKQMKADGVADVVIDKLIAQRKDWIKANKNVFWSNVKNAQLPIGNASCGGMGVEGASWGSWTGNQGDNSAGPSSNITWGGALTPPTPTTLFAITSGTGTDPNTPGPGAGNPTIPVVCPGFGNNSIVLNPSCTISYTCEQLTYPLTVTAADTNFIYAYAIVVQDGSHPVTEQPFVQFDIFDSHGVSIPCSHQRYTGSPGDPSFYTVSGNGCASSFTPDHYKPWTLVGINLSAYIGQTLNVVITNADCDQGGHFAYSYWDFLCGTAALTAGCTGNQSTICGPIDPNIAYTYQWYNNGTAIPAPQGTQQCITVTPNPGDVISVEVQQPSGCNFHMGYVPAVLQPGFTSTGKCGNYTFSDTSIVTPSSTSVNGWSWSFPGGTPSSATTQTASVTYNTPGTYSVTLNVTCSAGCSLSITHTITVTSLPTAQFNPSPACVGNPVTLTNNSVSPVGDPIASWNWSMPGASTQTSGTGTLVTTTYLVGGSHIVTLTVTTTQGCTNFTSIPVQVYNPPVAHFAGQGTGCIPVCVNNYIDQSTVPTPADGAITSWEWSFPGGTPSAYASSIPPGNPSSICYNTAGVYGASLIVTTAFGCKDTTKISPVVSAYSWPQAGFCIAPDKASATDPVFSFCPQWSSDVTQWTWSFGDNDSDIVNTNPVHSYSAVVANNNDFYTFDVCLNVKNQYGCWDTTCHTLEIIPEYEFYIPNTFSPNNDYINEYFFGKCRGVKEYNIWLFDRWGNLIWDCHKQDKNTNWDGSGQDGLSSACKWDGKVDPGGIDMSGSSHTLSQEDSYVWKVKLTDVFDKGHTYIGNVNIIR
ncbi:MAG TPA: PKD domain-containing protein [Bacteroidia bacterium]